MRQRQTWDNDEEYSAEPDNIITVSNWDRARIRIAPEPRKSTDPCAWTPSGAREKREWLWDACVTGFSVSIPTREFHQLVSAWLEETGDSSLLVLRHAHWAYLRIIGLGKDAVPWILNELRQRPDWWFEALSAITGEDPVKPEDSFDSAVEAWLEWGRINGYDG